LVVRAVENRRSGAEPELFRGTREQRAEVFPGAQNLRQPVFRYADRGENFRVPAAGAYVEKLAYRGVCRVYGVNAREFIIYILKRI
jgi:hypothetical protein